jgi:hypothetical protein
VCKASSVICTGARHARTRCSRYSAPGFRVVGVSASDLLEDLAESQAIDWPAPSYEAYRKAEVAERRRERIVMQALPELAAVCKAAEQAIAPGSFYPSTYDALVWALRNLEQRLIETGSKTRT